MDGFYNDIVVAQLWQLLFDQRQILSACADKDVFFGEQSLESIPRRLQQSAAGAK
jgi:hypothetical protein